MSGPARSCRAERAFYVNTGASFTLTSSVANAYSATLQQCFATNTAGDTTGWTGIKTSNFTAADATPLGGADKPPEASASEVREWIEEIS